MKLTQFYVTPWCSPTRSALLTGRDAIRNGVYNSRDPINGAQPVLFIYLFYYLIYFYQRKLNIIKIKI